MKLKLTVLAAVLALSGCATAKYQAYADVHKTRAQAEAARYAALADIARQGDTTAKVAAVITLNQGGSGNQTHIAPPKTWAETALQWTATLLPSLTTIYSVQKQTEVGITQSNNARELGISTNRAFVDIAGKIQAPAANVTNTTTTTTNTDNSVRSRVDSTHTPTVVTQPDPVIVRPTVVTQPAPVIVPTTPPAQ